MDLSNPFESLIPGPDSAVLSVLATTIEYRSGSEISRLAGRSHPTAIKALKRLVDQGLVESIDSGRSSLYILNRDHLAAEPILKLAGLRKATILQIREQIGSWQIPPVSATIFGSFARGEGDENSDIDLLLVRPRDIGEEEPNWQEELFRVRRLVYRWTGNHLAIIEIAEHEVSKVFRDESAFYENVKREGVHIAGTRFSRLPPL